MKQMLMLCLLDSPYSIRFPLGLERKRTNAPFLVPRERDASVVLQALDLTCTVS
jgi:hypothetical protein